MVYYTFLQYIKGSFFLTTKNRQDSMDCKFDKNDNKIVQEVFYSLTLTKL